MGIGSILPLKLAPGTDKRYRVLLLRSTLLIAVGGLLVDSAPVFEARTAALALVLTFALSNVALFFAPLRWTRGLHFELGLGAADIILVALSIQLTGETGTTLLVSSLCMLLVVALGNTRAHTVAGATAVGALHSWLVLGAGGGPTVAWHLTLQMMFLCSVALYYGYLVEGIRRRLWRKEAAQLQRHELNILLEILDAVTSSLNLGQVTRTIVSKITEVVPAARCSMLFVNPGRTTCYVIASHDNPALDMLEIDLGKYPEIRQAIETRSPVLIRDVSNDPAVAEVRAVLEALDLNSIMVVPMVFGDDVLGTLCLKTTRSEHAFGEQELNFCKAVAHVSANALKNALLHRDVSRESSMNRETGEKLSNILDNSPDLILTTDRDGHVTEFNRGAEKLTGFSRDEVLGQTCHTLFGGELGTDVVTRILEHDGLANHACCCRRKDGSELELELNMAVLRDERRRAMGTVWVGRDVTELKSTQLQLLQAKKLSTIGEVISGVAHELNNPLSGVLGFSQLLLAKQADPHVTRDLERIHDSAIRCQKIVKNLLSFARQHKPERRYLGVNGILLKTIELRKYQLETSDIQIVTDLSPTLPQTMLDFHQMQQVFLNLINNAQHAMAAVHDRPGRLLVRTSHNGVIRIEIRDNGEGMDQERMERIFDPFFTTKPQGQGTGLGLSVSYGIVEEHGGRIFAHSRRGHGTSFFVELPIRAPEATPSARSDQSFDSALAGTPASSKKTILVVDDEPMILDLMIDILGGAGHRVDTASNGDEACRKAGERVYDVIISDVRMPQMNGMQLYQRILATRPEMERRFIFISGDLIDKETVRFLRESHVRSVPKPLEIATVLQAVEAVGEAAVPTPA